MSDDGRVVARLVAWSKRDTHPFLFVCSLHLSPPLMRFSRFEGDLVDGRVD
jgi:hypothetical protein